MFFVLFLLLCFLNGVSAKSKLHAIIKTFVLSCQKTVARLSDKLSIGDELLVDTSSGLRPDKVVDIVSYTMQGILNHMLTTYRS